jgi:hypothetical protein
VPLPYEAISYPNNTDFFQEVVNGTTPSNLILARYVNKLHNALAKVEETTQYSAYTPTATGYFCYIATMQHIMKSDLDDLKLTLNMTVDSTIAAQHFAGSPFSRSNALFVSAIAYRIISGVRTYESLRAAVNVIKELNNTTCVINLVKPGNWRKGTVVDIQLKIVRL